MLCFSPTTTTIMEESTHLPLYSRRSCARQQPRRESPISMPRSSSFSPVQKFVHSIPVILLLTFFILWWFSYPVNLVIKDGRIVEVVPTASQKQMIQTLNDTNVELAILASAISPIASSPDLNLTTKNDTKSLLLSKPD